MYKAALNVIYQKNITFIEGMMGGGADGQTKLWTYRQTDGRTDEEKGDVQGQTLL